MLPVIILCTFDSSSVKYPRKSFPLKIAVVPILVSALGVDVVMFSFLSPSSALPYTIIDGKLISSVGSKYIFSSSFNVYTGVKPSTFCCNSRDCLILEEEKLVSSVWIVTALVLSSPLAITNLTSVRDSGSLEKYSNISGIWLVAASSLKIISSNCAAYNCLGESITTLRRASCRVGADE